MLNKTTLFATSAVLAIAVSTPAFAQVDEVITTATKRQTTLQETPVAVTVTSADVIEKSRIADIKDLQSVVPSLRVNQLQNSQNTNFVIRGFGNGANNAGIEPSVGVFIDGVYRSRSAAQISDLPILERVEVLRGPQSTLFGKNASAGVISVVTAKPKFEQEGYIEGGIANFNGYSARGYYTNALDDKAAFSIGGGINVRDGYFDQALSGVDENNSRNRANIRGQLLVEPSDRTTARFIADYSSIDENCCGTANFQNLGAGAVVAGLGGQVTNGDTFSYINFQNKESENTVDDYGISAEVTHDMGWATLTSISAFRKNDATFDSDADFGTVELLRGVDSNQEIETLTQELRLASSSDGPLQWMVGGYFFDENVDADSGITYGAGLRRFIEAGLTDALQPGNLPALGAALAGSSPLLTGIETSAGNDAGSSFAAGTDINEFFTQDNTALSLFGTIDYDVTDRLTLTLGGNYTSDEKDVTGFTVNGDSYSNIDLNSNPAVGAFTNQAIMAAYGDTTSPIFQGWAALVAPNLPGPLAGMPLNATTISFLPGGLGNPALAPFVANVQGSVVSGLSATQFQPQFLPFPNSVESGRSDDSKFTYTVRGAYEVNDNLNVYASYATGFKSSSWNLSRDSRPFLSDFAQLSSRGLLPNNYIFAPNATDANNFQNGRNAGTRFAEPEEARVIELGAKMRFERGALNVAVFDQQIEGFQSNVFLGTGFGLANSGEQITQGLEFDAAYSPFDSLDLTLAGTFLDAKYESFVNTGIAIDPESPAIGANELDLSGESVAGVSPVSLVAGATFNSELANGWGYYLRGTYLYESEVQVSEPIPTIVGAQPERTINSVDLSAGLDFGNDLELQVWVRNATEDEYITTYFAVPAQSGIVNGYPSEPRTYGMNLRKSF